jgi:hypothetical protein
MNDKTEIKLTLDLVDAVLQYLGTRPYQEVFKLVAALQSQAAPQVQAPEVTQETTVQ